MINSDMITRLLRLAAWGALGCIVFATLAPLTARPHVAGAGVRYEHIAAFAVMGLLFGLAYPRHRLFTALFVLGSAMLLEGLQYFTPDRHARILDAAEKMAGSVVGLAIACLLVAAAVRLGYTDSIAFAKRPWTYSSGNRPL